ncbi:MAG TPA: sigma-70 family RNA polymerase sigma factor [Candidatus Faeciplasma pullistercoris]|uniref:Sigma-70 family RNA polymerase sigma factor n=1 Tax=Candidatus Faeciplasma pullistercoris TaxID=2840800 RepID=A0A9D1GUH5_9FIRM|nr:sigma-70 family RNA polymerase sigma factor [Candidatus Faeciplasma pullistercoris]
MFTKSETFSENEEITVEGNLGLVRLCAGRFRGKGIEYDELYSAGCVGLVKAVKAFDPERGVRFSTYAVPVILGEIRRLFRDGGAVKVSRAIKERSLHISRLCEQFEKSSGRQPCIDELCELTGLERFEVIEALSVSMPTVSLTSSEDSDKPQTDIPVEPPDTKITDNLALHQVLSSLCEADRQLIYCRFFKNMTQQQTADRLGMTQVQVSRREKKLLEFLRSKL